MHALLLVLTWSLYIGVLGLQDTDSGPWGPPRERLRTRKWGQLFGTPLGYFELLLR
jgi:hypothetical protein